MNALIVLTAALVTALLLTRRVRDQRAWRATVTPLASIMGSGFLVSAPLVASEAGAWAPVAMGALLAVAFGIGAVLRWLIRQSRPRDADACEGGHEGSAEHRSHRGHEASSRGHRGVEAKVVRGLEASSQLVLAGAYVVSVSYYLQLLAAFVLERLDVHDPHAGRLLTTGVLVALTAVGGVWGLRALERVETYAVSLNLGVIAALLVGLLVYDGGLAWRGELALPALAPDPDRVHGARVLMGLLIVVQGFETSRFLGAEHPAEERARTMRIAQLVASGIYLAFVTLMLPLLTPGADADVTAIIGLVGPVATVLPVILVIAALGSQLSAAIADDAGCAGLLETVLEGHVPARWAYVGIGAAAITLTWLTDVLSVISVASRAFALFYALQCAVAVATAAQRPELPRRRLVLVGGALLGLVALSVTVLGVPAE